MKASTGSRFSSPQKSFQLADARRACAGVRPVMSAFAPAGDSLFRFGLQSVLDAVRGRPRRCSSFQVYSSNAAAPTSLRAGPAGLRGPLHCPGQQHSALPTSGPAPGGNAPVAPSAGRHSPDISVFLHRGQPPQPISMSRCRAGLRRLSSAKGPALRPGA